MASPYDNIPGYYSTLKARSFFLGKSSLVGLLL